MELKKLLRLLKLDGLILFLFDFVRKFRKYFVKEERKKKILSLTSSKLRVFWSNAHFRGTFTVERRCAVYDVLISLFTSMFLLSINR